MRIYIAVGVPYAQWMESICIAYAPRSYTRYQVRWGETWEFIFLSFEPPYIIQHRGSGTYQQHAGGQQHYRPTIYNCVCLTIVIVIMRHLLYFYRIFYKSSTYPKDHLYKEHSMTMISFVSQCKHIWGNNSTYPKDHLHK